MQKPIFIGLAIIFTLVMGNWGFAESAAITLNGAGASFPYPVYSQWAHIYNKITGVQLNYQSIGSGGGIAQIKAKTVDFGASDAPLKAEELNEFGLIQFPMIMGGVVPVVNVPGVNPGQLKLSPEILVNIFLGKIERWDDPAIKALNPDLQLPAKKITVVHRADGSGTTWIFTSYLDKISVIWHGQVGHEKAVDWPVGVGGKGNEGVSAYVQRIEGSIGYVEFAYARQNNLTYTQLLNIAGKFVSPTIEAFQAAAANADWKNAPGYYMVLTNQPGELSWPITGASFILMYKEQQDATRAKAMLAFFDWSFKQGGDIAKGLDYVPVPPAVVEMVEATWSKEIKAGGQSIWP
jgi:phosphate transport system substrate-binding protein